MPTIQRTLYPAYQGPVNATFTERVSEDKWHQPWSEPLRFKILPALAIALATASGQSFDPFPFPNGDPSKIASTWFAPFTDPVRLPKRLHAAYNEDEFLSEFPPFAERVSEDKWHFPWSEPVRVPPNIGAARQLAFTGPTDVDITIIGPTAWFIPFTDPVRFPPRLGPALNPFQPDNPFGMTVPETVSFDRWNYPWSEPVRVPPRLTTGAQQTLAWVQPGGLLEQVTESRWHQPWSEPKRYPPTLLAGDQLFFVTVIDVLPPVIAPMGWYNPYTDPVKVPPRLTTGAQTALWLVEAAPFTETVSEDRWHQPWSEPKRFKPDIGAWNQKDWFWPFGLIQVPVLEAETHQPWSEPVRFKPELKAALQQFLAEPPDIAPEVIEPTSWFNWFSEPVRLKPGLLVDDQPFVGFQVIEPLFPNFLLTVRNQILRYPHIMGQAEVDPFNYPPTNET